MRFAVLFAFIAVLAAGQPREDVRMLAAREKQPLLDTLKELVAIESGTADYEGVTRIGQAVADRLRALGGEVETVPPAANMPRFQNTPPRIADTVVARFRGNGTKRILLLAHLDTVYPRGMLSQQPFRIEGDRAYGLGIADDKHGIGVILHGLAILRSLRFQDYGLLTVLMSPDEEIGSNAERDLLATLGSQHDLVLSFEGATENRLWIATTGVGVAIMNVEGRASHAGIATDQGRNALYELSHQMLQTRDLSDASRGLKLNWTMADAGIVSNQIPANAQAVGDVRVQRLEDFDRIETAVRQRLRNSLIPDTTVQFRLDRMYPPMAPTDASRKAAATAQRIYAETGGDIAATDTPLGAGTDAAFASLRTTAPVLEGLGLLAFGAHSNNAEYILISSIEPRLYLMVRLIQAAAAGGL